MSDATSMYHMTTHLNLISNSSSVVKTVKFRGKELHMKIDSGAGHSIISENTYNSI